MRCILLCRFKSGDVHISKTTLNDETAMSRSQARSPVSEWRYFISPGSKEVRKEDVVNILKYQPLPWVLRVRFHSDLHSVRSRPGASPDGPPIRSISSAAFKRVVSCQIRGVVCVGPPAKTTIYSIMMFHSIVSLRSPRAHHQTQHLPPSSSLQASLRFPSKLMDGFLFVFAVSR